MWRLRLSVFVAGIDCAVGVSEESARRAFGLARGPGTGMDQVSQVTKR